MNTLDCLWRFRYSCRAGTLEGLFVATDAEVDKACKKSVYYGEVLGKHSEVEMTLKPEHFERLDVDMTAVAKLTAVLGKTLCGRNPLAKIAEQEEEEREADADAERDD